MDPNFRKGVAWTVVIVAVLVLTLAFLNPDSSFVSVVERFQTLITGILAGIAALVGAGLIYSAAMLPIEAERRREKERAESMRIAGAAQLLGACQSIYLSVISEAAKSPKKRAGRLVSPDSAPSLETIGTQDLQVISSFQRFMASASRLDAHTVLKTWKYDPDHTHPEEKAAIDKLISDWTDLRGLLIAVTSMGEKPPPT